MSTEERMTGQTTRIVDEAIQELFTKGEVTVTDHMDPIKYPQCRMNAYDRVLRRLNIEHKAVIPGLKMDRKKYRMWLPMSAAFRAKKGETENV
jgi:hypothetical protein